jgi:hypothetical protein
MKKYFKKFDYFLEVKIIKNFFVDLKIAKQHTCIVEDFATIPKAQRGRDPMV